MEEGAFNESTASEEEQNLEEEKQDEAVDADFDADVGVGEVEDVAAMLPQNPANAEEDEKTAESKSLDVASRGSLSNFGSFDTSDDLIGDVTLGPVLVPPSMFALQSEAVSQSVTPHRKEQLLLQARSDRLRWIQQVPLPYETKGKPHDRFSKFLHYSQVSQQLPSVALVLQHLYGHDTDRVDALLETDADDEHIYLTGNQILAAEIEAATDDATTKSLLISYQKFLNGLQDPACAVLVQGMRSFCRNFRDISDSTVAASKLKAYAAASLETVKQHVIFKEYDGSLLQSSLGSFLYGQCRSHLESLMWTAGAAAQDNVFREKLQTLQFVTPAHLEIHCLVNQKDDVLKTLLAKPVAALQSVDQYHSVYEKLQRILAIYRDVNAALTLALHHGNNEKLPSADDVLPTIILTVLMAMPARLSYNLQLVEELSPPEYLRGEAGYAFTILFGARQFLQDLNLESEPASLMISEAAFRDAMAAHKSEVERRIQALDTPASGVCVSSGNDDTSGFVTAPPPLEIRQARLRGELVDLDWALQWQAKIGGDTGSTAPRLEPPRTAIEKSEQGLPAGFRRNYSFLTSRSEDIRVNDLPQLLEEYRMLVHATEKLLGERVVKAAAERKAKARAVEKDLLATARSLDPALVPDYLMRDQE
jgi:Vacuolar sorting protein 9 (VPS9) domain